MFDLVRLSRTVASLAADLKETVNRLSNLEGKVDNHIEEDLAAHATLLARFDQHDAQVQKLHAENQATNEKTLTAVTELKGTTTTFTELLPQIKLGIQETEKRLYRRRLLTWVWRTVVSTLVTVAALIPLLHVLAGLHISFHLPSGD